jgi:hypothetical protein
MKARHKRAKRRARMGRRKFWAGLQASLFDVNRSRLLVTADTIEESMLRAREAVWTLPPPGPIYLSPDDYALAKMHGLLDPPRPLRSLGGRAGAGGGREWQKRLARRNARFCELRTLLEMTDRQRRMLDEMWRHFTEKVGGQVHTIHANLIATDPGFNLQAVL